MWLVSQRYLAPCNVSIDQMALFYRPATRGSHLSLAESRELFCYPDVASSLLFFDDSVIVGGIRGNSHVMKG